MDNIEIAKIFNETADILEIKNANPFRVVAYRRAAQVIEALPQSISEIYQASQLTDIPGIGEGLSQHLKDLITKGKSKDLEKIKQGVPSGLIQLMKISNLGPKRVRFLYKKFKVTSLLGLKKLLASHKLLKEKGWGEKSEQNIQEGLRLFEKFSQRLPLGMVDGLVQNILTELKNNPLIKQAEICGSFRRSKETVGDLDFLATAHNPAAAIDFFCHLPEVKTILAKGPTKANVLLFRGLEADLRVVKPESFGAALHYFTGSKAHNIAVRKMGMEKGLKINEYGVYKIKNQKSKIKSLRKISGKEEMDIFKAVGLPWIPPEIREDMGEIKAAQKNNLPHLICQKDIKGDLHIHSNWSDGSATILKMAQAAKKMGYEYLAITDHTPTIGITHGLTVSRVLKQLQEIKKVNQLLKGIKVLSGIEVDIKKDGSLDLPNKILVKLDLVVASIHTSFRLPKNEMTKRMIRAISNPYVDIIGHPTAREINHREPIDLDLEDVFKEAKKNKTVFEINSFWNRLDLNDVNTRLAKDFGVKLAISTDAHNIPELNNMKFGLAMARRGWLEKKDVVNTLSLNQLLKTLK